MSILILRYLTPQKPPLSKDGGGTIKTIDEALRYVSLIPFIDDWQAFEGQTGSLVHVKEFLELRAGDWEEHAVLLINYMMYIDLNAGNNQYEHFFGARASIPEGETVYVLRKEKNAIDPNGNRNDASMAKHMTPQTRAYPLSVGCLINTENIYANIQDFEVPSLLFYDLNDKRKWKPFFTEKQIQSRKLLLARIQNWSILRLMKGKLKVSNVRLLEVWNLSCKYGAKMKLV